MSEMLTCNHCGKEFKKVRKTAKYCSQECGAKQWYIDFKARGRVNKFDKEKPKYKREKKEKPILECVICGNEFRQTRIDRVTCSRECVNRLWYLRRSGKIKAQRKERKSNVNNAAAEKMEPYLLDWKRRRFMLNEIDLFNAINLWDMIYPNRYIPDVVDREQLFEELITDLILHYKRYKSRLTE